MFVAGSWGGNVAERHFGRSDPGQVVIDEVMGMLITLFLNPVGWLGALAGFLLFRIFDVIKPYPANRLEQLHGGIGVMADDAMAAVYANLVLRAALRWVIR
jgi:phosphatidylglycerophosphatase A